MMHIPYKSTQDATNDVLAGRTQALIVPNVGALPYLKDGRVRLLGVTSRKPSRFLPGVPAIADAGLPGYEFESWFGLLAPAKIPKSQIQRINSEVGRLLRQPQIIERQLAQGVEPTPLSPEAFASVVRDGGLVASGMPKFDDLSEADLAAIRHYLRKRAADLRAGKD